jgi:hypothetical protein
MSVSLEARLLAVMSVELTGIAAETAGLAELAIGPALCSNRHRR